MTTFRRSPHAHASLVALLMSIAAGTSAAEMRHQGANGDGGACPESAEPAGTATVAAKRTEPAAQAKPKATPAIRGGAESSARPRWHSFLPGMFR